MPGIVLPDGTRIDDEALSHPSVDAQFLANGIRALVSAINTVQLQLDTLIRMECGQVSRHEIKNRMEAADKFAREAQEKAEAEQKQSTEVR